MPTPVTTAKKSATKLSVVAPARAAAGKPKFDAPAPKKTAARKAPVRSRKGNGAAVPDEQRRHYVEVAAYYIAERRGFAGGSELEDWIQAEVEVDRLIHDNLINF